MELGNREIIHSHCGLVAVPLSPPTSMENIHSYRRSTLADIIMDQAMAFSMYKLAVFPVDR